MNQETDQGLKGASCADIHRHVPSESASLSERMADYDHATLTFMVYDHVGQAEFGTDDVLSWLEDEDSDLSGGLEGFLCNSPEGNLDSQTVAAWLDHYVGYRWGNQVLVRNNYGPPRWKVLNQCPMIPADWFERTLDLFTRGYEAAFGAEVLTAAEIFDRVMDDEAGEFGGYLFDLQRATDWVFNIGVLEGWLEQCKGIPANGKILLGSSQSGLGWQVVPFSGTATLITAGIEGESLR
jgi:hypothetical protein